MSNDSLSPLSRRGLLRLGILIGMLGTAGCGEGGTQTVTTPPVENGNRSRLDGIKEKADAALAKKKKK
jgi:hypothetical protein